MVLYYSLMVCFIHWKFYTVWFWPIVSLSFYFLLSKDSLCLLFILHTLTLSYRGQLKPDFKTRPCLNQETALWLPVLSTCLLPPAALLSWVLFTKNGPWSNATISVQVQPRTSRYGSCKSFVLLCANRS